MNRFELALGNAEKFVDKIPDPLLQEITRQIFQAIPPTGPEHAKHLAQACRDNQISPSDFLTGMYRDPHSRRLFLDAINAAHGVVDAKKIGHDEFVYKWLKILVAVAEEEA